MKLIDSLLNPANTDCHPFRYVYLSDVIIMNDFLNVNAVIRH